jgi:acyl-CoA dehydrogenase
MRRVIDNFPVAMLRWPLRMFIFPLGSGHLRGPGDRLGTAVAQSIVADGPIRDRIVRGAYYNEETTDALGRVLHAYRVANKTSKLRGVLHDAIRSRDPDDLDGIALLMGHQREELVNWAVGEKLIDESDRAELLEALTALYDVIRVDAFDAEGIKKLAECAPGARQVVERKK